VNDRRDAVQTVEEGDLVDVATEQYDYTNPMEVAAVQSREVWETPAGPDILVASLEIDGARTTYSAEYNGGQGTFTLESSSVTHEITQFDLVDDTDDEEDVDDEEDEDTEEATGEATPEATDEPTQEDETDDEGSSVSWTTSSSDDEEDGEEVSADGGTAAKYSTGSVDLDPSEHAPDEDSEDDPGEEWDMSFDVPDGITQQQVRSAVKGSLSLQGVLESLDWPDGDERAKGRVRAMVFDLGLYDDLVEPESWDRDRARQRGWQ